MSTFRTGLGQEFAIERRLPRLGWRPRRRDTSDFADLASLPDFGGDDLGILAVIGLVILAIAAVIVLLPLLLFVAEVALVVALVIPVTVVALAVGLKRHAVVLVKQPDGGIVDQREVRGLVSSIVAVRALRSAAERGAYSVPRPR